MGMSAAGVPLKSSDKIFFFLLYLKQKTAETDRLEQSKDLFFLY